MNLPRYPKLKKVLLLALNEKVMAFADQVAHSGCGFIVTLLLVRLLSPEAFGTFTSIFLFILFAVSLSNAIVVQPLQVSLCQIKDQRAYLSFAFFVQLLLLIGLSVLIILLLQIDLPFINGLKKSTPVILLFANGFLLHDFFRKTFLAQGKVQAAFFMDLTAGVLQVGIFTFLLIKSGASLHQVIFIAGLAYVPSIVGAILFHRPGFQLVCTWKVFLNIHLKQGKWLLLTAVLQWWGSNLFVIASGAFLGAKALGAFRLVQSVFGVLNLVLQTLENYALPLATRILKQSTEDSKSFLKSLSFKSAAIAGSLLLTVLIFPELLLNLIAGPTYLEYVYLVKGMSVLYFIIFLGYPIRIAIRMLSLNQFFFLGYVISFSFSLVSFNYLLREWHLWGAIIGLIANQLILLTFWQYVLLNKQYNLWK